MKPNVVVVGLDGATWDVLLPMMDRLPSLAGLLRRGAYGRLQSSIPPVTAPAWKCYSTGKNPGKLGVYYQVALDFASRRQELVDSRSFHSLDMWDYMGSAGQRVAIINMPTTFPPRPVNGIMVTGPYSDNTGYTYPPGFEQTLRDRGWRIFADELLMSDRKEDAVDEVIEIIKSRFDLAREVVLEHDVDFLHLTVFHIDTIQHFLWQTPAMERVWTAIDRFLGQLLEVVPRESHVVIMSDHGFEETRETFYLSTWLRNEGYLTLRSTIRLVNWMSRLGLTRHSIYWILRRTGLMRVVRRLPKALLRHVGKSLPMKEGTVTSESLQHMVDFERSKVISIINNLYLNPLLGRREEVIQQLTQQLKRLRLPGEDEPFVLDILRREDIYTGPYVDQAPDLYVEVRSGVFVSNRLKQDPDPFSPKESTWKAHHASEGIFLVAGPSASGGHQLDSISIVDLAPTIMHLMGLEIPGDLDGRVILEAFESTSEVATRKPQYGLADGCLSNGAEQPGSDEHDDLVIVERLRGMGYLD